MQVKDLGSRSAGPRLGAVESSAILNSDELLKLQLKKKINYWGRTLAKYINEFNVIFTRSMNNVLVKTSLNSVFEHLIQIDLFKVTKSVHFSPNPLFVIVKFDEEKYTEIFKELSAEMLGATLICLSGNEIIREVSITIDNLPDEVVEEYIPPALFKWGRISSIKPDFILRPDGKKCTTGQTKVELLLHDAITIDMLPYSVYILGVKIFLNIKGRRKICFRCASFEHLVGQCPIRFCPRCRGLKPMAHECRLSFAKAVMGSVSQTAAVIEEYFQDENLANIATSVPISVPVISDAVDKGGSATAVSLNCLAAGFDEDFPPIVANQAAAGKVIIDGAPMEFHGVLEAVMESQSSKRPLDQCSSEAAAVFGSVNPSAGSLGSSGGPGKQTKPKKIKKSSIPSAPLDERSSSLPEGKTYELRSLYASSPIGSSFSSSPPKKKVNLDESDNAESDDSLEIQSNEEIEGNL